MDNQQFTFAYAIAKSLGYEKSVDDFAKEYDQYCKEAKDYISSHSKPNTAKVVKNPFMS